MHILSISLDPQILDTASVAAHRMRRYGAHLSTYTIIIPTKEKRTVQLSENVVAHGTGGWCKLVRFVRTYRYVLRHARTGSCDAVSTQDPYFTGLIGLAAAKRCGVGLEVQVHGLYALTRLRIRIARFVLARAGSIRCASMRLVRQLRQAPFRLTPDASVHVVPVYTDVAALGFAPEQMSAADRRTFDALRTQLREQYAGHFNILTVSRLIPVKNISLQLDALTLLVDETPSLMLHIVGEGSARDSLQREVERRGIGAHVQFHGAQYRAALGAHFAHADCFVLSSDAEGWGMVAIEAAAAGLPIIMTDVGCAGTVIKDEESGLVVPVGDREALAAAIRRIVHEPQLRAALSARAQQTLVELPTFDEIASDCVRSWKSAYEHALVSDTCAD